MEENEVPSNTPAEMPDVPMMGVPEVHSEPVAERVIPKRVLVRKSDAAIEVEVRDAEHYDTLVGIHGVGALEVLS